MKTEDRERSLEIKMKLAGIRTRSVLRNHDPEKVAVACSFGKDSMLTLHYVRQEIPDVKVVFANTGVEFPSTLEFRNRMVKEWNLNYHEARPETNFWKLVEQYGFPTGRLSGKKRTPQCCIYLKEKPAMKMYKELGVNLTFLGITADESWARSGLLIRCGDYHYVKDWGLWKAYPIWDFTETQVLEATKLLSIPLNPCYLNGGKRTGCMPCTGHKGWQKEMARAFPKMYKVVQHRRGQRLIDDLGVVKEALR